MRCSMAVTPHGEQAKQFPYYCPLCMEHYADVTGHAPEFPYWASGFWQCKLRYKTQKELLGV